MVHPPLVQRNLSFIVVLQQAKLLCCRPTVRREGAVMGATADERPGSPKWPCTKLTKRLCREPEGSQPWRCLMGSKGWFPLWLNWTTSTLFPLTGLVGLQWGLLIKFVAQCPFIVNKHPVSKLAASNNVMFNIQMPALAYSISTPFFIPNSKSSFGYSYKLTSHACSIVFPLYYTMNHIPIPGLGTRVVFPVMHGPGPGSSPFTVHWPSSNHPFYVPKQLFGFLTTAHGY